MPKLYVRAICPGDIKPIQLVSRNWATNYEPWYIAHQEEKELADTRLDQLYHDWCNDTEFEEDTSPAQEFEDFADFLEERGYKTFYTAGNIWMPVMEEEDGKED